MWQPARMARRRGGTGGLKAAVLHALFKAVTTTVR
jgi:hypothetical protein